MMSTGELMSIEPQELQFPFELKKHSSCSMQLTNQTDNPVAFKVKTTNPKKYCVRPNSGIVLPRSTCVVIVTMQAQKEAPPGMRCEDKFMLQSLVVSPGFRPEDITSMLFNKESGNRVEECKLKVMYVAPRQPMQQMETTIEMDIFKESVAMTYKTDSEFEIYNPKHDFTTLENMTTRSDQICSTEVIDDTIVDAENKKEILNITMDSVLSLLNEVELKEKVAYEAVEEAGRNSMEKNAIMEELKQAQQRAKEVNVMLAGKVKAHKAALAIKMKELQRRVSGVLNEEDVSLEDLDKMCISLEKRLTSAQKTKEAADKEKLNKEVALAYEKGLVQKIVEETKRLEQEASENLKLQEFLVDRGYVVDMLEEYISCRCQDVNILKKELKYYEDGMENVDTKKSSREVKHTEKVAEEAVEEACREIMDELKQAQQYAKEKCDMVVNYSSFRSMIQKMMSGWAIDRESIPNQQACKCRKGISSKKDIKAKRFRTQGKNKVTKKWIDELINEAVTDYEEVDHEQDDY